MPDDFIGLEINGPGQCGQPHPLSQLPCIKPAGHEEAGDSEHNAQFEVDTPPCPDCGGPMELKFMVLTDDDALAARVFQSYQALKHIDDDDLKKLVEGGHHVHIVADAECKDEGEEEGEDDGDTD